MKRILITGVTGQDGSYLAEMLLDRGDEVHGMVRRTSLPNTGNIDHLRDNGRFRLHDGDLTDTASVIHIVDAVRPDEIYNLGAMSHVRVSFETPEYAVNVAGLGALRLLEAIRHLHLAEKTRFYQASTSEMYGLVQETPQRETTPFYPRNPYAIAKLYAYWATVNYREAYGVFACNGILFNHESPRRGEAFVTRKITLAAARISCGLQDKLVLGNFNAQRDWGHARDYVDGMWRMLQQPSPDDYVLATGTTTTVRRFAELAFREVGIDIAWEGSGVAEKGRDTKTGRVVIEVNPNYFRPSETDILIGDATKARDVLGWQPRYTLEELVREMVAADVRRITLP